MILEARNKKLKISFGLGIYEKEILGHESFNVWIETIFNSSDEITMNGLDAIGDVTKVSDYQYSVSPTSTGNFTIFAEVENRTINKISNSLKIEVK